MKRRIAVLRAIRLILTDASLTEVTWLSIAYSLYPDDFSQERIARLGGLLLGILGSHSPSSVLAEALWILANAEHNVSVAR